MHWHSQTYAETCAVHPLTHARHCQAASTFPIKPDDLIDRCKEVILAQAGIQDGSIDESIYADDFRFCESLTEIWKMEGFHVGTDGIGYSASVRRTASMIRAVLGM